MLRILFIDNYDSFSDILIYYLQKYFKVDKIRNDDLSSIHNVFSYQGLILSPGPGNLEDIGNTVEYVDKVRGKMPIFGVCLGFQYICSLYGGRLKVHNEPLHGVIRKVSLSDSILLKGLSEVEVVFYNSLYVDDSNIDGKFIKGVDPITGRPVLLEDYDSMIYATQFHPEAFSSKERDLLFHNLFNIFRRYRK